MAKREELAQRRKALGLTQEKLAELLKVDRTTVVRWERGEAQPTPSLRPELARVLKVSVDQLGELLSGPGSAQPGDTVPAVPRQLPATLPGFTGRAAELQTLTGMLDQAGSGAPGTVVICAIGGTAGVGKTALGLHWAHQIASRFPDGQLHVNLRGFDPSGTPVTVAEAVAGFLDALGVPPEQIPHAPEAQAALYRSTLADRRMLIVLDNARDEQQVRPLLPASPGSLVIITSRRQLTGLAATDGAGLVIVDVLTHAEAVQLLTTRLGASRASAEPGAVAEIARLCACLPLALAIAAARAAARPRLPLRELAAELRDAASRLDTLDSGDPSASVRTVFSWSYRQLSSDAARMFRLLGLHPGPDISAAAAASLAAVDEPAARRLLGQLSRACLICEHASGRYAFHDLLRTYAASQARACDRARDRTAAVGRVLDHYLHTAARITGPLCVGLEQFALPPPRPGTTPERPADHRSSQAWSDAERQVLGCAEPWFDTECRVLLAAIALAATSGFDSHAWQLAWYVTPILEVRWRYQEAAAIQRAALAAATRAGDTVGQATSSFLLGGSLTALGHHDEAAGRLLTSLELYQRLGDDLSEAGVHHGLGIVASNQGRYEEALGHCGHALALHRAAGNKGAEANVLNTMGWYHGQLGDYQRARAFYRQALSRCLESHSVEAAIWRNLGGVEHRLGNPGEAAACFERAVSLCREAGLAVHEAIILTGVGDTWHAAGDPRRARQAWQQALAILDDMGHPLADQVRGKLDSAAG